MDGTVRDAETDSAEGFKTRSHRNRVAGGGAARSGRGRGAPPRAPQRVRGCAWRGQPQNLCGRRGHDPGSCRSTRRSPPARLPSSTESSAPEKPRVLVPLALVPAASPRSFCGRSALGCALRARLSDSPGLSTCVPQPLGDARELLTACWSLGCQQQPQVATPWGTRRWQVAPPECRV